MTDASPSIHPARLQELEEVTREYGSYGRTAFGLGYTALGAWMTLAALVHIVAPDDGRLLLVLAAPLWFGMVAVARRSYQRRGAVTPLEVVTGGIWVKRWPSPRVQGLLGLLVWSAIPTALMVRRGPSSFGGGHLPPGFAFAIVIACIVLTAVLAWLVGRGFRDTLAPQAVLYMTWMMGAWRGTEAGLRPSEFALLLGLAGLASVVKGVYEHRRFVDLERRLAALRV